MFDRQGRLVICEAANRRVTRIENDGTLTVLADRYDGHRFNQPNDLTLDSRGRIYFSDPCYGDRSGMEMLDAEGRKVEGVYRIDPDGRVSRDHRARGGPAQRPGRHARRSDALRRRQ